MTSWTSSIWINIPSANIGNQQSMVMARYSGGVSANDGNGFEMGYDPGGGGVWVAVLNTGNSWAWYGDMPATISPDTWTMVTTTVTAAGINLYIDGVQVGATQGLTQSGGTPMFTQAGNDISIGYTKSLGGCSASLDEFDLFSSVLSGGQITQLYTNQLSTAGSLPSTTPLQIAAGAAFDLNGNGQTVASLSDVTLGSGGIVTNSGTTAATLTLAASDGNSTTFSGTIQNGSPGSQTALTLNGNGTQVLTGTNSYSGPTTIAAGTLQAGSSTGLGDPSAVVIASTGLGPRRLLADDRPRFRAPAGNQQRRRGHAHLGSPPAAFGHLQRGDPERHRRRPDLSDHGWPRMQVLAGANTYSGLTTITAGTLQIGNGVTGSIGSTSGFAIAPGGIAGLQSAGHEHPHGAGQRRRRLAADGRHAGPRRRCHVHAARRSSAAAASRSLPPPRSAGPLYPQRHARGSINSGGDDRRLPANGFNATMHGNGASYVSGDPSAGESSSTAANHRYPVFDQLTSWTDSFWVNMSRRS